MHGIIAGLWSSLSGAGRFVSRLGSGILVDHIGFDNTAGIVTALQVITVQLEMSSGNSSSNMGRVSGTQNLGKYSAFLGPLISF